MEIELRIFFISLNKNSILLVLESIKNILIKSKYKIKCIIALPIKIKRFCVLRSPHVDKDAREHFEIHIYKYFIDILVDSSSIFNILTRIKLPSEVSCLFKLKN